MRLCCVTGGMYFLIGHRHLDNEIYPDLSPARNRCRAVTVDRCVTAAAAAHDDVDDDGESDAVDMATSQCSARIGTSVRFTTTITEIGTITEIRAKQN